MLHHTGLLRSVLLMCLLCFSQSAAVRGAAAPPEIAFSAADVEFFEKRIRPLLVQHCHECHAAETQEANLRLDSRGGALAGGDSGPAVVPGDMAGSLLLQVIAYAAEGIQMPPSGKLAEEEIALLTEWVVRGAPWPAEAEPAPAAAAAAFNLDERADFWSLRPLSAAPPPAVQETAWPRSAIDRYILAQMESAGAAHSPEADRRTLIRRLSFDLLGLPPTQDEVAEFLADEAPGAYERLVERLLASPHFGERWARHWLDLARYAESCGHEFDYPLGYAFEYRDYLIRAFNADVPYDQFVREHVAGDLLREPRRDPQTGGNESLIATGFFFLGEMKHSPVDIISDEAERVDNQIDVFSKTFLAMTVGCARCHDHKFDAISQRDYYALAGFLQSSRYQEASLDPPALRAETLAQLHDLAAQRQALLDPAQGSQAEALVAELPLVLLARDAAALGPQQAAFSAHVGAQAANPLDPLHAWAVLARAVADGGEAAYAGAKAQLVARLQQLCDERAAAAASLQELSVSADPAGTWFPAGDAFAAEELGRPAWKHDGQRWQSDVVGIADSGRHGQRLRGVLRSPTVELAGLAHYRLRGKGRVRVVVDSHRLVAGPLHGVLNFEFDTGGQWRWHTQDLRPYAGHKAWVEFHDEGDASFAIDRVAFGDAQPADDGPWAWQLALLAQPSSDSLAGLADAYQQACAELLRAWRSSAPGALPRESAQALAGLLAGLPLADETLAQLAALDAPHQTAEAALRYDRWGMAFADGTGEDSRLYIRGSARNQGAEVPRRFLEALGGAPVEAPGSGRLHLADALTDPRNPLVARVIVNRLWHHHFGTGLVPTVDDFGHMGQPPTHPELLDYLAGELIRSGWSLKHVHRLIVTSSVYRQASQPQDDDAEQRDPLNKLYRRFPIRRLEAESIRDALLTVSGRLDRRLYGPSVLPFLTEFTEGRGRPASGPLDGDGRRSIYLSIKRNFLPPLFTAFDFPVPFSTIGRRSVSNVPAQALALMNNPFVRQQAELWAARVQREQPDAAARVAAMYEAAYARPPSAEESSAALQFVAQQALEYGGGDAPQAWSDLAHVLLTVKEFVFVR